MNLSELIRKYGDDKVELQNLDQCSDAMNMSKGVTKITFGTPQPMGLEGMQKLGLVIWLDRERIAQIIAAEKVATPDAKMRERVSK